MKKCFNVIISSCSCSDLRTGRDARPFQNDLHKNGGDQRPCWSASLLLSLAFVFLVSCATTPDGPTRIAEIYHPLDSGALIANGAVEVTKAQLIDAPGYKGCTIQMVNHTDAEIVLAGIVRWYESDGSEARKGRPAWRRITLTPGQPVNLPSIAPVPWCTEFGLEVRSID